MTIKVVNKSGNDLPKFETEGAAGADLKAFLSGNVVLQPNQRLLIPTGLFFEIPKGYEIQIRSRSGLASKYGVIVLNSPGTIDSDYRGEVKVLLYNSGDEPFKIMNGDRIAQAVIAKVEQAKFLQVETLDTTERGEGGFGSTGI